MYLHTKDLIHGDIKDENILVAKGDLVKIIDFGCTYKCQCDQLIKKVGGTITFMSPEVFFLGSTHNNTRF